MRTKTLSLPIDPSIDCIYHKWEWTIDRDWYDVNADDIMVFDQVHDYRGIHEFTVMYDETKVGTCKIDFLYHRNGDVQNQGDNCSLIIYGEVHVQ